MQQVGPQRKRWVNGMHPEDGPGGDETLPVSEGANDAASPHEQLTMGLVRDRYTVIRSLGRGGMGEVFLCRDAVLDLLVAVKFPTDALSPRFIDEARNASRLNHPNIARLYHFDFEPGGRPFIVMEYVDGQSLSELLDSGPLPVERTLRIMDEVLAALAEAHASGIIHRDVTPRNIMITPSGQVKVLDFGLAKRIRSVPEAARPVDAAVSPGQAHHTQVGRAVGTARYMSPEQARGEEDVDERCDVFAAGAILFECLTGQPAFASRSSAHPPIPAQERPVPAPSSVIPGIPAELDAVVAKALAKERDGRYRDAVAMRAALPISRERFGLDATLWNILRVFAASPRRIALTAAAGVLAYFLPDLYDIARGRMDRHPPEAVRLYEEGLAAIRDGTYHRASKALEQAISIAPQFMVARARYAESLYELEYTDRANSELLKVLGESRARGDDAALLEALRRTFSNNTAGAVQKYQELSESASGERKAQALLDLGRALERDNRAKEALARFEEAIRLNSAFPAAFLRSGILLDRLKGAGEADAAFRRAEQLYQALSNTEGQAEVWYQRGRLDAIRRRTAEAMAALNKSLELARNSGSAYQEIKALLETSGVLNLQANPVGAEQTARRAIEMARRAGIANLAARGQITLGNSYLVAGAYDKAEPEFREALAYSREHEIGRSAARALFSLASLHSQLGKPNLVIDEAEEAARFFNQGGFKREASMCVLLRTRALRQLGRLDEALVTAREQMKLLDPSADKARIADFEDTIASTLLVMERFPEARSSYRVVLETTSSLGDRVGAGYAHAALARVSARIGDMAAAKQHVKDATAVAGAPGKGLKSLLALIACVEAEADLIERRDSKAAARAGQAISLAGDPQGTISIEARMILSLARARSGALTAALVDMREALAAAERYGNPNIIWRSKLAAAEVFLAAGELDHASTAAADAASRFTSSGQLDSAWRAQALLSECLRRLGRSDESAEAERGAAAALGRLRSAWPAELHRFYFARPDLAVRPYLRFVGKESAHV